MKSIKLFTLSVIATASLLLISCSSENAGLTNDQSGSDLLKTFKVKRDLNGAYSLDFQLKNNAIVDKIFDDATKTEQFYLYSSDVQSKRNITESVELNGSQLKVGFVDTTTDENPSITITDDNISFAKGNSEALTSYEVKSNEDGTYQLDFTVKNNITVDFVYNEELETYEVHLDKGKNDQSAYTRTFEKEEGKALLIDFLNFYKKYKSKTGDELLLVERKPKIIIDE